MVASAKQTEIDKCSIGKGMVAITKDSKTRDDIGIATYIADDFEDVLLGYHCALITPNPAIVDGKYLNAFMHTRLRFVKEANYVVKAKGNVVKKFVR